MTDDEANGPKESLGHPPSEKCTIAVENPNPDLHGREVLVPEALAVTSLMESKQG